MFNTHSNFNKYDKSRYRAINESIGLDEDDYIASPSTAKAVASDPDIFVTANKRIYGTAKIIKNLLTKRIGRKYIMRPEFILVNNNPSVIFTSPTGDGVAFYKNGMTHSFMYFPIFNFNSKTNTSSFEISSEVLGVVQTISIVCDFIKDESLIREFIGITEAFNPNASGADAIFGDKQNEITYAKGLLSPENNPKNAYWGYNEDLVSEFSNLLSIDLEKRGIIDIAKEIDDAIENNKPSQYIKFFTKKGNKNEIMQIGKRHALLHEIYKAILDSTETTVEIAEEEEETVVPPTFLEKLGMTHSKYNEHKREYESSWKNVETYINAMVKFYKEPDKNTIVKKGLNIQLLMIPGKGGIGKSSKVYDILANNGLKENYDFVTFGSTSTTQEAVYNFIYNNNGKIIVFDDTPNLFDSAYKLSFWKNLIPGARGKFGIGYAQKANNENIYYNANDYKDNNRKRYYAECGHYSHIDPDVFLLKKAANRYTKSQLDAMSDSEKYDIYQKALGETRRTPSSFKFTGCIILLTNDSMSKLARSMGGEDSDHWTAMKTRAQIVDVFPLSSVLWMDSKESILSQKEDMSIADDDCIIPRQFIDEYIEEVEKNLTGKKYTLFTFRINDIVRKAMIFGANWRDILKTQMNPKGNSNKDKDLLSM